jgi:hypothetical protein
MSENKETEYVSSLWDEERKRHADWKPTVVLPKGLEEILKGNRNA